LVDAAASRRDVGFFFIFVLSPYLDALLALKRPDFNHYRRLPVGRHRRRCTEDRGMWQSRMKRLGRETAA